MVKKLPYRTYRLAYLTARRSILRREAIAARLVSKLVSIGEPWHKLTLRGVMSPFSMLSARHCFLSVHMTGRAMLFSHKQHFPK